MAKYRLSNEAQNDLREIQLYTMTNLGNQQAKQYLIELTANFEKLAHSPKIGRRREEIHEGLRSFQARHHIVFNREKLNGIAIARILHTSMDIKRHLEIPPTDLK
jgi:toxin ParE1/3/4